MIHLAPATYTNKTNVMLNAKARKPRLFAVDKVPSISVDLGTELANMVLSFGPRVAV
jgi:hypothetical protein